MDKKYRVIMLSGLLVAIVGVFTFPNNFNDKKNYYKIEHTDVESYAESNYIARDAKVTTNIHLSHLYMELEDYILHHTDGALNTELIKKRFPEVVSVTISKRKITNNTSESLSIKQLQISPVMEKNNSKYVYFHIPVNNKTNSIYILKIKLDIYEEVKNKQELRLFTVTNLQNNRWKTNPTKYLAKKKLNLSLNERLPDIKPKKNDKGISHYITDELVIKFNNKVPDEFIKGFLNKYNLTVSKRRDHTIIAKCKNKCSKKILDIIEKNHSNDSNIMYCEPHFIYLSNDVDSNLVTPNDRLYSDYQWNLQSISTEQGWEKTRGNKDVIIAVIDTGVDLNHPEFKNKLVTGYNVVAPDKPPVDDDGHGTHVTGIIAANTNNKEGIAGVTWFNKIMPIKVLDQSGAGTLFDVAEGIFWATDHGAKVINLSLGNYAESNYLHDAIKYAHSKDVILVSAAGNDRIPKLGYPASYPEVISVGAVNYYKKIAEFSNYGDNIDVVAPGVNIASTYPKFDYASLSGTSMACPHVTGLAALIRSIKPNLKNTEIAKIIKETATDLGYPGKDKYYGYGEINIEAAINSSVGNLNKNTTIKKSPLIEWLRSIFKLKNR